MEELSQESRAFGRTGRVSADFHCFGDENIGPIVCRMFRVRHVHMSNCKHRDDSGPIRNELA